MGTVRRRPQGGTKDNKQCSENEGNLSPEPVTDKTYKNLTNDSTWYEAHTFYMRDVIKRPVSHWTLTDK